MRKWVTENMVLVSGIVLPVLLVVGFFILNTAPRLLTDPPQYDFVLVAYHYDYQHPSDYYLAFEVRDGKFSGKVVPRNESGANLNRQYANVFRYNATENSFEEIIYDLPEGLEGIDAPIPLRLADTESLMLDKRKQSPDGFSFEFLGYRGRGGLLGEMFGMGRRYESGYVLKKGGANFELPKPASTSNYYQNDLHFMGWVINEDSGP
jgi:hypothetical protein